MKIRTNRLLCGFFALAAIGMASCSDSTTGGGGSYNPGQPIAITDFYPDSGGVATPMIIHGSNFGTDTTGVKLWYIDDDGIKHKGGLVSMGYDEDAKQDVMYAYVPSGLTYKRNIQLQLEMPDGSTSTSNKNFLYRTQTAVTTIVGKQSTDRRATVASTMASSELSSPLYLCVDDEDNIFIAQRKLDKNYIPGHSNIYSNDEKNNGATSLLRVDMKKDEVTVMSSTTDQSMGYNAPAFSDEPGLEGVYVPNDKGVDYVAAMKENDYVGRQTRILAPTTLSNNNWKYCFVVNKNDHMIYTVMFNGQLVRINPKTRKATVLLERIGEHKGWNNEGNDAFCAFSPVDPDMLYVCLRDAGEIWRVDVSKCTKEGLASMGTDSIMYHGEPYAGRAINEGVTPGRGFEDGKLLNAKFNRPSQICFTADGKLYIADAGNECIRRIDTTLGDRAVVSTVIGIPGERGFQDGGPEIAKFDFPTGVAVSADGRIVYVSDAANQVIRRLSIE